MFKYLFVIRYVSLLFVSSTNHLCIAILINKDALKARFGFFNLKCIRYHVLWHRNAYLFNWIIIMFLYFNIYTGYSFLHNYFEFVFVLSNLFLSVRLSFCVLSVYMRKKIDKKIDENKYKCVSACHNNRIANIFLFYRFGIITRHLKLHTNLFHRLYGNIYVI